LQEGTYKLEWTLSNGTCPSSSDFVFINIYDQPIADAGNDILVCDEGIVTLVGNAPQGTATGLWTINTSFANPSNINIATPTNNTTNASYILEGEYQFIWSLSNGNCPVSTDTVSVTRYPKPLANFIQLDNEACVYECIEAENTSIAIPPYSIASISWTMDVNSFASFSTDNHPEICIETPGTYDLALVATSSNGCTDTLIVSNAFTVLESPTANFSYSPSTVEEFEEVQFENLSNGATNYKYTFGDGDSSLVTNPTHIYELTGTYTIGQYVSNAQNCADTMYQTIVINEKENLLIPNAFTPNGNGNNDVFKPMTRGLLSDVNNYHLMIFDRWGKLLFESYDIDEGWDGTFKNKEMPLGVYVWQLSYKSNKDTEDKTLRGHVTLVR